METHIALEQVTKHYGGRAVVDGVTLEIRRGEFFSLLGSSGCGKSTTLRMIAGFETPDAGRITFRGAEAGKEPAFVRQVNMVFQNYALFPHLTVGENVAFGLKMAGVNRRDREQRAAEMLALVQLAGMAQRMPAQLSGGQQQRVALARALAPGPSAVLLDEPLGALDLRLRRELQEELQRIHADRGLTFVYVTHDQEEALALSGRICVMHAGRAVQTGTPEDIYERPRTEFVAGFIGGSNFFTGRVRERTGTGTVVECGGGTVLLPGPVHGESVRFAVRPERMSLSAGGDGKGLPGTVERSIFCGGERRLQVRLRSGEEITVRAVAEASAAWQRGDAVHVHWPVEAAMLLEG